MPEQSANKARALDFLNQIIAGNIENAYKAHVNLNGKHHNMFTKAGFTNLMKGMQNAEDQMPNKKFVIKNVFGDDELVAVHSHLTMNRDSAGMATVHMFRFKDGKIVEMWDVAQAIPGKQVNTDGAF